MPVKKPYARRKSDEQINVLCTQVQELGSKVDILCTSVECYRGEIGDLKAKVNKLDTLDGLVETMDGLTALGKLADKGSAVSKRVLQWSAPIVLLYSLASVYWNKAHTWVATWFRQ